MAVAVQTIIPVEMQASCHGPHLVLHLAREEEAPMVGLPALLLEEVPEVIMAITVHLVDTAQFPHLQHVQFQETQETVVLVGISVLERP